MYNQFPCDTNLLPTGVGSCVSDLTVTRKLFLFKKGYSIADMATAQLEATWDTGIQNQDIIPFDLIFSVDNTDEEPVFETSPAGFDRKIRQGKKKNTFMIVSTMCSHKRMYSYDQFSGDFVVVDLNGNIIGTSPDAIAFKGITIDLMSVSNHSTSDGTTSVKTGVYISEANPAEYNVNGASFKVDWPILGKNGLLPVSLAIVGTPTATEIVVNATTSCENSPVSGLETPEDWVLTTGQTITTATESATILGQYTLAGTGLVTGTLNLADPGTPLSVTGYASVGAVTVTIA